MLGPQHSGEARHVASLYYNESGLQGGHISVTGGGLRGGLMAKREPGRGCLGMARAGGLGARCLRYRIAKYAVIRAEEKGLGN